MILINITKRGGGGEYFTRRPVNINAHISLCSS